MGNNKSRKKEVIKIYHTFTKLPQYKPYPVLSQEIQIKNRKYLNLSQEPKTRSHRPALSTANIFFFYCLWPHFWDKP